MLTIGSTGAADAGRPWPATLLRNGLTIEDRGERRASKDDCGVLTHATMGSVCSCINRCATASIVVPLHR
jgi:hypothetical protein